MTRRFTLSLIAIASVASLLLAACGSAPAAPALTDPKEILSKTILSLKDVKTVELTGTFTGNVTVPNMGALDLSTTKLSAAMDIPGKKAKFNLDAPSVLGTKVDAILLDNVGYLKISGLLAGMAGVTPDKYSKTDLPTPSADPSASASTGDAAQVRRPRPPMRRVATSSATTSRSRSPRTISSRSIRASAASPERAT